MKINEDLIKNVINVDTSINNKSRVNFIKSKNLFDKSNVEKGYLNVSNGSVTSSNDWNTTQFISLSSNVEHITIIGNKGANEGYCFYDSSKTFISGGSMRTSTSQNIIIPSNAKYFRITVSNDVLNSYAIYFNGNTTDGYQPYVAPSIVVDGETIYGKVEHKIFEKTVTASGWSTPLKLEDYNGYDFITFYIISSDFKDIITLPIGVLKLRRTENAYTITSNNKQYMSVGMYGTNIMLYRGYADSIEIILWK